MVDFTDDKTTFSKIAFYLMVHECTANQSIVMHDEHTYISKRKDADKLKRLYDLKLHDVSKAKISDLEKKLQTAGVKPFIVFKSEYKDLVKQKYDEL